MMGLSATFSLISRCSEEARANDALNIDRLHCGVTCFVRTTKSDQKEVLCLPGQVLRQLCDSSTLEFDRHLNNYARKWNINQERQQK